MHDATLSTLDQTPNQHPKRTSTMIWHRNPTENNMLRADLTNVS